INNTIFKEPNAIACNQKVLSDYLLTHNPEYLFIVPILTKSNEGLIFLPGKDYFRLMHFVKQSHTINAANT
ncbi:MAG: aminoglycoside phosphotransferase family protein, partial [Ginsengibacter sp.]